MGMPAGIGRAFGDGARSLSSRLASGDAPENGLDIIEANIHVAMAALRYAGSLTIVSRTDVRHVTVSNTICLLRPDHRNRRSQYERKVQA